MPATNKEAITTTPNKALEDALALIQAVKYYPGAHSTKIVGKEQAEEAILAWHQQALEAAVVEAEKAYGACHNCYGKGYATVSDLWHGYDTDEDIGSPGGYVSGGNPNAIKFCTCDRGKQLQVYFALASKPIGGEKAA